MSDRKRLIIDCDPGLDDACALLMALAAPNISLLALTTCHGNASVDQVSRNALRILHAAGRLDIPVYKGASCSLLDDKPTSDLMTVHGEDGLGDVHHPEPIDDSLLQSEHAVSFLQKTVHSHPEFDFYRRQILKYKDGPRVGEITLLCIGPLTNLALALRLDPSIGGKLKECYIMGGNYSGKGNVTPSGEFNFLSDPEAAKICLEVLGHQSCSVFIAPWELCLDSPYSWETRNTMLSSDSTTTKFYKTVEDAVFSYRWNVLQWPRYNQIRLADPTVMTALLDPSSVETSQRVYCTVETSGGMTRGQMVVDWSSILEKDPNVTLIMKINIDRHIELVARGIQLTKID